MADKLNVSDLYQFSGTENWYKTIIPGVTYTDGVRYVAQNGRAYWLIDQIACAQLRPKIQREHFQHWTLKKDLKGSGALLRMTDGGKDGSTERVIFTKQIAFTDFPLDEISLYCCDGVILLPSEY